MFTARQMLRQAPRLGAQLRAPVMRNVVQRRLASTESNFVKERRAVKEHAESSTGMSGSIMGFGGEMLLIGLLTRRVDLWRKISL
jgi:hypothetical protein